MQCLFGPQLSGLCLALVLVTSATGQEKQHPSQNSFKERSTTILGGNADRWLQELIDSRVDIETRSCLDRLSCFHLSSAQLERLTAAADQELSCEKRVLLWQAMRQSRNTKTRDHLVRVLLEEGTEMQTQFLDELDNPTRFDVPILIALYQSQPKAYDQSSSSANNAEAIGASDLFDVRGKIAELASRTPWNSFAKNYPVWEPTGWPQLDEDAFKQTMFKRVESNTLKSGEAQLAQEQIIYWLIRNGYEDEHRLMAFEMFVNHGKLWRNRRTYVDMGNDLLKGLDKPASRAKAVHLVMPWIDPHKFLLKEEAESVRLSAIEAMHLQLAKGYVDPNLLLFDARLELWKPALIQVRDSDPSAKVMEAARQLLERIAACEQDSSRLREAVARNPP